MPKNDTAPEAPVNEKKYAKFNHSFSDPWEGTEQEFSFRFARPSKVQIKLMQKAAVKDYSQAMQNLLINIIHPDEKATLVAAAENYPGLYTSFGGAIIKAVGIADLGN